MNVAPFSEFYGKLRKYFVSNENEYKTFCGKRSCNDKIVFLLEHPSVKEGINSYLSWNAKIAKKPKFATFEDNISTINPKNERFPNLSRKALVSTSTTSGRRLIAKEKINPG